MKMTVTTLGQKRFKNFSNELLELGKIANPSNPYLWVAEKFEMMSKWNNKDWEVIFKRKLTFNEVRKAQVLFEKLAKDINDKIARWYK